MDSMIILRTDTKIEGNLAASTGTFGNEKSVISVTDEDIRFKTPVFGVSTEYSFIDLLKKLDDIDAKTGAMEPSEGITNDYNTEGLLPSLPIPDGDYTIALTDGFAVYELTGSSLSITKGEPTTRYTFEGDELDTLIEQMQPQSSGASTYSIENGTENHTALVIPTIIGIDPIQKRVYFKIAFVGDASNDTVCDAGDYIYRWKPLESELHVSLGKADPTEQPSVSMPVPASDALLISYEADTSGASTIASIEQLKDESRPSFHVSYAGMFKDRSELTKIDLSQWSFANVSDMSEMFMGCYGLGTSGKKPAIDMCRARPNEGCSVIDIFKDCTENVTMRLIGNRDGTATTLRTCLIRRNVAQNPDTDLKIENAIHHPGGGETVRDFNNRCRWYTENNGDVRYIMFTSTGSSSEVVNGNETLLYSLGTWYGRLFGANGGNYLYGHNTDFDYRFDELTGELEYQHAIIKENWYCSREGCGGHHEDDPADLIYPSTST